MLSLYDNPSYEDVKTCHLMTALQAAMQIQKKKVVVGPNDAVGIMLFNTVRSFVFLSVRLTNHNATYSLGLMTLLMVPRR